MEKLKDYNKMIIKDKDIDSIVLDESRLLKIEWVNNFSDLIIQIDWCGQEDYENKIDFENINSYLLFNFVTEAEFNFKFNKGEMGGLEITEFNYQQDNNIWYIEFKFSFYPKGYVKFRCDGFKFIIETLL